MLTLFITAFALGMVFNASPGAVFAETVRQGVRGGFRPALAVQIGSLVGDALWAVLGLAGVGLLMQLDALRVPVGIAGVIYLLWLARDAWMAAGREFSVSPEAPAATRRALRSGVAISVTNPGNVAYWAALGSAMGAVGISEPQVRDYGVFFAGFMTASVVWSFVCAAAITLLFKRAGTTWARVTYRLCAAAFLLLALSALRELLQPAAHPLPSRDAPAATAKP